MIRPIDLGFCYGPSWAVGVRALNKDEKLIMCIGYICIVNGSLHFLYVLIFYWQSDISKIRTMMMVDSFRRVNTFFWTLLLYKGISDSFGHY